MIIGDRYRWENRVLATSSPSPGTTPPPAPSNPLEELVSKFPSGVWPEPPTPSEPNIQPNVPVGKAYEFHGKYYVQNLNPYPNAHLSMMKRMVASSIGM